MPLPRFDFAPDEWPPLAVGPREGFADAVFKVAWDGEEVEVMAREVRCSRGYFLIFFRASSVPEVVWAAGSHSGHLRAFHFNFGEYDLEDKVRDALQRRTFGRARHYRDESGVSHWVYLEEDKGTGCWNSAGAAFFPARFRLSQQATLEDEMNQQDSDARFAFQWSHLAYDEMRRRSTLFLKGDWDQVNEVVRAIIITSEAMQKAYFQSWSDRGFEIDQGIWHKPDARLRRWHHHLLNHFQWIRNEALAAQHLCVQETSIGPFIDIQKPMPTHHERLEAVLRLRDWAQGKIPPDELRLLLPKL